MLALARKRCRDEKGTARKAGLELLEALMTAQLSFDTQPQLPAWDTNRSTIAALASDPLVGGHGRTVADVVLA